MNEKTRTLTRRTLLRGAGVALALPWLESLAPRRARGQVPPTPLRFVPVYFPMGTASFWTPTPTGDGDAWQLSPILKALQPVKDQVTVLSHVDNTAYGAATVAPSFPRETSSFLTCAAAQGTPPQNGISVDQVIANALAARTPRLPSLQLGLSTLDSSTEDLPPAFSRSISWASPTQPLLKTIDPQSVFDLLVSSSPTRLDPALMTARDRQATNRSVLDFVLDDAQRVQTRLATSDRRRLDQFMGSVRDLELAMQTLVPSAGCGTIARPAEAVAVGAVPADLNHDDYASLMIDLIVMALSCDVTRVVSLMMDDARSAYAYDILGLRTFSDGSAAFMQPSVPLGGSYFDLATTGGLASDGYATVNYWFARKLSELCQKLAAIPEANDRSVLDNSVIWFGSGMNNGVEQSFSGLPVLYVGGGGGNLKVGSHLDLAPARRLSDVYLTFMQKVFGLADPSFADSTGIVPALLA